MLNQIFCSKGFTLPSIPQASYSRQKSKSNFFKLCDALSMRHTKIVIVYVLHYKINCSNLRKGQIFAKLRKTKVTEKSLQSHKRQPSHRGLLDWSLFQQHTYLSLAKIFQFLGPRTVKITVDMSVIVNTNNTPQKNVSPHFVICIFRKVERN